MVRASPEPTFSGAPYVSLSSNSIAFLDDVNGRIVKPTDLEQPVDMFHFCENRRCILTICLVTTQIFGRKKRAMVSESL